MLRLGQEYRIADLLPHGPGFVLLDRLAGYDQDSVTCEVTIRRDSPFCADGGVPAWVGMEYMAQTMAAHMGIRRQQAGQSIRVCLLLGARLYECATPAFAVGTKLSVSAELLMADAEGIGVFKCELRSEGRLLAESEIKAYNPEDIEPYLQRLEREHAA